MYPGIREVFPSLLRSINGRPAVYLDGPAGTQIPAPVIRAISDYYHTSNANTHGQFTTALETDALIRQVREECAIFLNAPHADCISFGQNMTSLCFSLSRGIGRLLKPGDEVVITQLDHEANRGPWLTLQNQGVVVREITLLKNGTLDYEDAARKINRRTKLVAAGVASNMLGTVNDIALLRRLSREVGAWLLVDAVHSAPHFLTDVHALDCDFLLCSAYKFYGPHVGILYSRPGLLNTIPVDRLRVQEQRAPYMIETGTLNHAALAGVGAAIRFIASLGHGTHLRAQLEDAFVRIHAHEISVAQYLWQGLRTIQHVHVYGPAFGDFLRAPTIAFRVHHHSAESVCKVLAGEEIFAWDGHFYAIRAAESLDLLVHGGVVRTGIVVYNTHEEVDQVLTCIRSMSAS